MCVCAIDKHAAVENMCKLLLLALAQRADKSRVTIIHRQIEHGKACVSLSLCLLDKLFAFVCNIEYEKTKQKRFKGISPIFMYICTDNKYANYR